MSFLAAVPAAVGTGASGFPIAANLMAGPSSWAATNAMIGGGTAAAAATPLAQGVIGGSLLASGAKGLGLFQTLGMSPLGGMASMVPNAATGLGSLAATAPAAGSTLALESAKAGIIQNAMTQNAMQNAIMQNMAGGQAAQNLAGIQAASTVPSMTPGQLNFLRSSTAGGKVMPPEVFTGGKNLSNISNFIPDASKIPVSPAYETQAQIAREAAAAQQANAANAARIASDAARSQKMAVEAGLASPIQPGESFLSNLGNLVQNPSMQGAMDYAKEHPYATAGMGYGLYSLMQPKYKPPPKQPTYIRPYDLEVENLSGEPIGASTAEREQLRYKYTPGRIYRADQEPMAEGGLAGLANGGTIEQMSRRNAIGGNTMYPLSQQQTPSYSNPQVQVPLPQNVISSAYDAPTDPYTGEVRMAEGGMFGGRGLRAILDAVRNAPSNVQYTYDPNTQQYTQLAGGGISNLGDYSDGGRLLKGPGDGVSDSIPASIGGRQPARLADGEFVIPARIVSEIGNGSTDAGARQLYAMMDRIQKARRKSVGKNKVAVDSKADKLLPA